MLGKRTYPSFLDLFVIMNCLILEYFIYSSYVSIVIVSSFSSISESESESESESDLGSESLEDDTDL